MANIFKSSIGKKLIMSVSGIGEKTYADIADLVKVEVER